MEEQESGPFRSLIMCVLWVKLGLSNSFTEPSHSPWEAFSVTIRDVALPASWGDTAQNSTPFPHLEEPCQALMFTSVLFLWGRWESAVLETLGLMSLT